MKSVRSRVVRIGAIVLIAIVALVVLVVVASLALILGYYSLIPMERVVIEPW
jgi:hypothetical protein